LKFKENLLKYDFITVALSMEKEQALSQIIIPGLKNPVPGNILTD